MTYFFRLSVLLVKNKKGELLDFESPVLDEIVTLAGVSWCQHQEMFEKTYCRCRASLLHLVNSTSRAGNCKLFLILHFPYYLINK